MEEMNKLLAKRWVRRPAAASPAACGSPCSQCPAQRGRGMRSHPPQPEATVPWLRPSRGLSVRFPFSRGQSETSSQKESSQV